MKTISLAASAAALWVSLLAIPPAALAAPTNATVGGKTSVELLSSFLSALESLGVTPGAVGPGRIHKSDGTVWASFPITTGEVDLGSTAGEIDHAGGLSLSAGSTKVDLTAFAIDISKSQPVITGLVEVNGSFVGRLPLFDLSLAGARVKLDDDWLKISDVTLTLDREAASALSGVFKTTVPVVPVGTAQVSAILCDAEYP